MIGFVLIGISMDRYLIGKYWYDRQVDFVLKEITMDLLGLRNNDLVVISNCTMYLGK